MGKTGEHRTAAQDQKESRENLQRECLEIKHEVHDEVDKVIQKNRPCGSGEVIQENRPCGSGEVIQKNRPCGSGGAEEGCPQCHHPQLQGSYQEHKKKLLDGLKRVEGQVRGVQRMVDEERYCVDVLTQIAAARMALARLALIVLEDHTKGCVSQAIQEQEGAENTIEELMGIIRKMMN